MADSPTRGAFPESALGGEGVSRYVFAAGVRRFGAMGRPPPQLLIFLLSAVLGSQFGALGRFLPLTGGPPQTLLGGRFGGNALNRARFTAETTPQ